MTETMTQILDDVGFERWDEADQAKPAEIVHNLAACADNVATIKGASELVAVTYLRYCNMLLEIGD